MRYLLILPMLFMLASCGTLGNLSDAIAKSREILNDVQETYKEVKPLAEDMIEAGKDIADDVNAAMTTYKSLKDELAATRDELKALDKEAFAKADKDGDGDLDFGERLIYWLLLGGGSLEIGRRKLKQMREAKGAEGEPA